MSRVYVENGVACRDGRPEAWHLWSDPQRRAWHERSLMDFKRQGIDLTAIVAAAVKDFRRKNPTRRELVEKYNLEAKMSAALKEAVRSLRAEAAARRPAPARPITRAAAPASAQGVTKRELRAWTDEVKAGIRRVTK